MATSPYISVTGIKISENFNNDKFAPYMKKSYNMHGSNEQ